MVVLMPGWFTAYMRETPGRFGTLLALVGILILTPDKTIFSYYLGFPICSATVIALYGILTKYVSNHDSAEISLFWTAISGAIFITGVGLLSWKPIGMVDLPFIIVLCLISVFGHYCFIKAIDLKKISVLQPLAYLQFFFASIIGINFFNEQIKAFTIFGGLLILLSSLIVFYLENDLKHNQN